MRLCFFAKDGENILFVLKKGVKCVIIVYNCME